MSSGTPDPNPATFRDLFSQGSPSYAAFRPRYPQALFEWLATQVTSRALAWDAGAGTGQASIALTEHFERVVATDASAAQIAAAEPHPRITYRVAPAEASGLPEGVADVVTVAQALHWFDTTRFYAEVRRVVKQGSVIAVWTYGRQATLDPAIDRVLDRFYTETIGPFWPPERRHVDAGYATLPFPFPMIAVPTFIMSARWTLDQLLGYIGTWSAVARWTEATGADPLPALRAELQVWGDPAQAREVRWPLSVRAGRCT